MDKRSGKTLIDDEIFNSYKEKQQVITYFLKGKFHSDFKQKQSLWMIPIGMPETSKEFSKFNNYFNQSAHAYLEKIGHIYPGSNQIPTPPICQRVTSWFFVEKVDPEIDDDQFPRWIPLDSIDRKEIYASGKRGFYIDIHWF